MRILFLLLFSQCCFGQLEKYTEKSFKRNILNVEMGMLHRGLIGCSYERYLLDKDHFYLKSGGGLGLGVTPFGGGVDKLYYLSMSSGIGLEGVYLGFGLDYKYLNYFNGEYNELTTNYDSIHYVGASITPNFILTIDLHEDVLVNMRCAPLFAKRNQEHQNLGWGVGVSFGKKF